MEMLFLDSAFIIALVFKADRLRRTDNRPCSD
jgi:hypothetical protein